MKTIWNWIGSRSYWASASILTGGYLSIAVLGKTLDWWFAGTVALGFYLCWLYGSLAHGIKEGT